MVPQQFFYQLAVWGLLWLFVMLYYAWPCRGMAGEPRPAMAIEPRRKRSRAPQPFAGLTHTMASCVSKPSGLILYPVAIEVGERTLAKGEDELRHQLALFQTYHNFCLPHASLRQSLLVPEPTNGTGSAKKWRPCMPAMAVGLTDRVWSLREVVMYRVPPWPQPQGL